MAGERHADLAEARDHDVVLELGGARVEVGERGPRLALEPVELAPADRRRERGDRHRQRDRDRVSSLHRGGAEQVAVCSARPNSTKANSLPWASSAAELEREAGRVSRAPGRGRRAARLEQQQADRDRDHPVEIGERDARGRSPCRRS